MRVDGSLQLVRELMYLARQDTSKAVGCSNIALSICLIRSI